MFDLLTFTLCRSDMGERGRRWSVVSLTSSGYKTDHTDSPMSLSVSSHFVVNFLCAVMCDYIALFPTVLPLSRADTPGKGCGNGCGHPHIQYCLVGNILWSVPHFKLKLSLLFKIKLWLEIIHQHIPHIII